jgi:hypothetical protein
MCFISQEMFEDAKWIIRIGKSMKIRQHNRLRKKDKRTNNNLQNTTQKTKDRTIRRVTVCSEIISY